MPEYGHRGARFPLLPWAPLLVYIYTRTRARYAHARSSQTSCTSTFGPLGIHLKTRISVVTHVTVATGVRNFGQEVWDTKREVKETWNEQAHAQSSKSIISPSAIVPEKCESLFAKVWSDKTNDSKKDSGYRLIGRTNLLTFLIKS